MLSPMPQECCGSLAQARRKSRSAHGSRWARRNRRLPAHLASNSARRPILRESFTGFSACTTPPSSGERFGSLRGNLTRSTSSAAKLAAPREVRPSLDAEDFCDRRRTGRIEDEQHVIAGRRLLDCPEVERRIDACSCLGERKRDPQLIRIVRMGRHPHADEIDVRYFVIGPDRNRELLAR